VAGAAPPQAIQPGLALSVLDLAPVPSGATASEALANTLDLARHAESLGLARYWVTEHHNAAGIASSAPEVLVAAIAARTRTLRVGSGGIMLPNHSALKVGELFRTLHALHPGRIDLGLGRAPGTDNKTALALRRSEALLGSDGFPAQLDQLLGLLASDPDPEVPFGGLKAVPTGVPCPPVWILGSGGAGATAAGERGLGFAFAHHFSPGDAAAAVTAYRAAFRPSAPERGGLAEPAVILAVSVVCGETDAHAEELASSGELGWLRFGRGLRDLPLPSVAEARAHERHPDDEPHRLQHRARQIVGEPSRVAEVLLALAEETGAREMMATTSVHDHAERKRSYDRVLRALG